MKQGHSDRLNDKSRETSARLFFSLLAIAIANFVFARCTITFSYSTLDF